MLFEPQNKSEQLCNFLLFKNNTLEFLKKSSISISFCQFYASGIK